MLAKQLDLATCPRSSGVPAPQPEDLEVPGSLPHPAHLGVLGPLDQNARPKQSLWVSPDHQGRRTSRCCGPRTLRWLWWASKRSCAAGCLLTSARTAWSCAGSEQLSPAVHVHRPGLDELEEQMAEYRNRTSFVDLNLAGCQAAVRTHRVTLSDNGSYHCLFMEDTAHDSTTLWLQVAGLGSSPRIQVIHTQNRGVWAEYASEGWYPEPWVEWRNQRGQMVHAETNFSVLATTGLLAVVSRVALLDRAVEGLSCSITSPLLPERKVAESHLPAQQVKLELAIFVICQLGNFSIHMALQDLRPAESKTRKIPYPTKNPFTWLFLLVSCPNYIYDVGS
ncbi:Butyrophilin subfamily 2 member A2 [Fukomys damarensis]|uniref:Butyrophilin subfamily 2 member A2 n=1 Tax=Fukomys damarensis TaxID=885580 RepID=A0A091DB81_FUKDA|nr:Butyrophilin subfamily 2 member A2 [Fukomys damarensis]